MLVRSGGLGVAVETIRACQSCPVNDYVNWQVYLFIVSKQSRWRHQANFHLHRIFSLLKKKTFSLHFHIFLLPYTFRMLFLSISSLLFFLLSVCLFSLGSNYANLLLTFDSRYSSWTRQSATFSTLISSATILMLISSSWRSYRREIEPGFIKKSLYFIFYIWKNKKKNVVKCYSNIFFFIS